MKLVSKNLSELFSKLHSNRAICPFVLGSNLDEMILHALINLFSVWNIAFLCVNVFIFVARIAFLESSDIRNTSAVKWVRISPISLSPSRNEIWNKRLSALEKTLATMFYLSFILWKRDCFQFFVQLIASGHLELSFQEFSCAASGWWSAQNRCILQIMSLTCWFW